MVSWMLYRTRIELSHVVRCQSAAPAALYVRQFVFTELRIFGGTKIFEGEAVTRNNYSNYGRLVYRTVPTRN